MPDEIERKFLVNEEVLYESDVLLRSPSYRIEQGYLLDMRKRTLRIRRQDDSYILTYKGVSSADGLSRLELECNVPAVIGRLLTSMCPKLIRKDRYLIADSVSNVTWELDRFHGVPGLEWMVEVELPNVDHHITPLPWVSDEVTGNPNYYNSNLINKVS